MELHQAIEDTAGKRRFPHRLFVAEHPMHIPLHCEGQKPRQHSASKRIVGPCRLVTDTFDILPTIGICVYAIYHGTGKETIQVIMEILFHGIPTLGIHLHHHCPWGIVRHNIPDFRMSAKLYSHNSSQLLRNRSFIIQ